MNTTKQSPTERIRNFLIDNHARCMSYQMVSNSNMIKEIEWWNINGNVIILELHFTGGYQMYKPATDTIKIDDDFNYIKSLRQ